MLLRVSHIFVTFIYVQQMCCGLDIKDTVVIKIYQEKLFGDFLSGWSVLVIGYSYGWVGVNLNSKKYPVSAQNDFSLNVTLLGPLYRTSAEYIVVRGRTTQF